MKNAPNGWKVNSVKKIYSNDLIELYEDILDLDGIKKVYTRGVRKNYSTIVPFISNEEILVIKSYRHLVDSVQIELPPQLKAASLSCWMSLFWQLQVTLDILNYAALINTPAFPSDDGRILRTALVKVKKDYDKATKDAVKVGITISYGFMALGFLMMVAGSFLSGIWILLIGWFLNSGAQSYLSQHELSSVLSHVRLREIMNTNIISVKPSITVNELLNSYFNVYRKTEFPVVEERGDLIGAVTTKQVMDVQKSSSNTTKVEEIMIPKDELIVMKSDALADEALTRIAKENKSRIFVYEDSDRIPAGLEVKEQERQRQKLAGLISKTDILNVARERKEFDEAGRISTMGDKLVIVIPKKFHKETQSLRTKQVLVVVEDAIPK